MRTRVIHLDNTVKLSKETVFYVSRPCSVFHDCVLCLTTVFYVSRPCSVYHAVFSVFAE